MAAPDLYIPVGIESIEPESFPDVALYIRSGANYVLYKSHGRNFSKDDAARLMEHSIEFLFVEAADLGLITSYMESNAGRVLARNDLSGKVKGKLIYQTSINFVSDLFCNPEKVGDFDRSKRLIENLLLYLSSDAQALESLELVMAHNYYTFVHSLQVTALSVLLHSELYMLSHDEMVDVGLGTILHDFGTTFVPQEVLRKKRHSDEELELIRRHPEEGYRYLKENTRLSDISLSIVRFHHERNNGNGYPHGLAGDAIPRSAQVAAVSDVYCTLTVGRNCRQALSPQTAVQVMRQEMKGGLNDRIVSTLERLVGQDDEAGE